LLEDRIKAGGVSPVFCVTVSVPGTKPIISVSMAADSTCSALEAQSVCRTIRALRDWNAVGMNIRKVHLINEGDKTNDAGVKVCML
jgi:hypothetical protein